MATDDDIDRVLDEESPGPSDLGSVLLNDKLADTVSRPPLILDVAASIAEAVRRMREQGRDCVLLVEDGKLTGIFTERDVMMKVVGNLLDLERTPVRAYMTKDPATLPADAGVAYALNKMVVEGFRHIPLVDENNHPAGVVSMRDIIEYLCDFFPREVLNLPPDPRAFRHRDGA